MYKKSYKEKQKNKEHREEASLQWGLMGSVQVRNHISQQQAGAFSGHDHDYVHNIVELRDRISYQNEQCQRILLYDRYKN